MARLPVPGGDDGTWGDVLNQFLLTSHNADGTFSSSALPDGSVTNPKIVDGTVSEAKLDGAVQTKLNAVGGGDPTMGGDISGTASNAQIVAGAVGNVQLLDNSINATMKLLDDSIVGSKIQDAQISNTKLLDDSITNAKISSTAAIAQSKIANLTSDLAAKANTVHTHAIADTTNLQTSLDAKVDDTDPRLSDQRTPTDGSVTAAKLASDSVTEPKLDASNTPSNGQILSWNGTNFTWVNAAGGSFITGDGIAKMTVGTTAPIGPAVGDVWINT